MLDATLNGGYNGDTMGYPTKQNVHYTGIENEWRVVEKFRNNGNLFGLGANLGELMRVEHIGGTKEKDDMRLHYEKARLGVSIKRKTSSAGSFDYLNSSAVRGLFDPYLTDVYPWIDSKSGVYQEYAKENRVMKVSTKTGKISWEPSQSAKENVIKPLKKEFLRLVDVALDAVPSNVLDDLLREVFEQEKLKQQVMIVSHFKQEQDYLFNISNHPIYQHLKRKDCAHVFKKPRRPSASRAIVHGGSNDTNLRLRVCLNNGMSALLAGKEWSSNSSSGLCIKFQQDSPMKIVEDLDSRGLVTVEKF